MLLRWLVSGLFTLTILFGSGSARAEGARWYRGLDAAAPGGSAEEIARAFIDQRAHRLGLTRVQLSEQARIIGWRDYRVVRIDQEFDGLPVFGREVIVRIGPDLRVQTVTTNARADVDVVTRPVVSAASALEAAAKSWGVRQLSYPKATLGVQMRAPHGRLIWRVDGTVGLFSSRTWVDAVSGEVIYRFWRVWSAEAQVYEQNPVATPTLSTVTLQDLPSDATALTGDYVTAYRYVSGAMSQSDPQMTDFELEQTALPDNHGDYFFTPTTDASQPEYHDRYAELSVYYHVNKVYRYFRTEHAYTNSKAHYALANYGESAETPYDNAFFSPVGDDYLMAMGQGNHVDLGYDGDVTYHEFGHSVTDNITRMQTQFEMMDEWGMNTGPGAIHEGLSDYWAGTMTDDPQIGEYSLEGIQTGASRDLSVHKICPDDIWGESHEDGEVFGSTVWAARQAIGDVALADDVMYGALTLQSSEATFKDFAIGIQDTAQALVSSGDMTQTQYDDTIAALQDHNLLDCGRYVTLGDTEVQTNTQFNFAYVAYMLGQMGGGNVTCEQARTMTMPYINRTFPAIPNLFQFRKDVPAEATSLTLRVRHEPGTDLQFWIYARKGEMVHFTEQTLGGMFTLVDVADYDYVWGPFTNADQQVKIDLTSDPALEPGQTYYFTITAKDCTTSMQGQPARQNILVTGTTDDEPYTPDGGVGSDASTDATPDGGTDDGGGNKGCGCHQPGPGTPLPAGLILLGLVAVAWIRRRR